MKAPLRSMAWRFMDFELGLSNHDEDYMLQSQIPKAWQKAASGQRINADFGVDIMDALFNKFAYDVSQHASCTNKTTVTLVVSLIRK